MDSYSLKPVQVLKQSSSPPQIPLSPAPPPNQFRIKNVSGVFNSPLAVSGMQIKSDNEGSSRGINYGLLTIDIKQSQEEIIGSLRNEIALIQQQINDLERDTKLKIGVKDGVAVSLKKWFASSNIKKQQPNEDLTKQVIISQLMDQMKVNSESQCIIKLYKIAQALDFLLTKQFESVSLSIMCQEDKSLIQESVTLNKVKNISQYPLKMSSLISEKLLLANNILLQKNASIIQLQQGGGGASFDLKKDTVGKECKNISELISFMEKVKINLLVNKDFKQYVNTSLAFIKERDIEKDKSMLQIKEDLQKTKLNLEASKKELINSQKGIEEQKKVWEHEALLKSEQIKNIHFLEIQEVQSQCQKQIEDQELEHQKQVELLVQKIQSELESQVKEKIGDLTKLLEDQEQEIIRVKTLYEKQQQQFVSQQQNEKENEMKKQQSQQQQQQQLLIQKENEMKNQKGEKEQQQAQINIQMKLFEDLKKEYEEKIEFLRNESSEFKEKYQGMKAQNESLYQEILNLKQQLSFLSDEKDTITSKLAQKHMSKQEFCDTFENALREEVIICSSQILIN